MEFVVNNNADDYSVPLTSYTIGDGLAKEVLEGKQAVFDPAYPYIYLPADEFMAFATRWSAQRWPIGVPSRVVSSGSRPQAGSDGSVHVGSCQQP